MKNFDSGTMTQLNIK